MGISPQLATTYHDGDGGHEDWHGKVSEFLNGLFDLSTATPQPVGSAGSPGTSGHAADAGHVHAGTTIGNATPKAVSKTPAAGTSGFAADQAHVHPTREPRPADNGLLSWTDDPARISTSSVLSVDGGMVGVRMRAGEGFSLTNLVIGAVAQGSGLSNCYLSVYSLAGTRLGVSVDISSNLTSSTIINGKALPITPDVANSLVFNPGDEFLATLLLNGTSATGPNFWRVGSQNSACNVNLSAPNYRFFHLVGPWTTPPASIASNLASMTSTSGYWFGAS